MKILVTGAAGSGTSTLAAAIAAKLQIASIEADDFLWEPTVPPYRVQREHGTRADLLLAAFNRHNDVVVAGSVMGWGKPVEDAFTLVVFLYVEKAIRIVRLREREVRRFGSADPAFLEWAAQYDDGPKSGRSLLMHRTWLATRACPVLELAGDLSVAQRVDAVWQKLTSLQPRDERKSPDSSHLPTGHSS
ncbi:MAG: hypothetical protein EOO28_28470 [Comamonadaceae bacterium]|nr:MAG: hypothetical protein EOO28_28470 [Comamonadaceae bacterium]